MSPENVEVVREMFEAYAVGGFEGLAAFVHPDFEMRFTGMSHPLGGTSHGAREAMKTMTEFRKSFEELHRDVEEFIDAGADRVVVALRSRVRPRGGSVGFNQLSGILYTLRDGKIVRMEWFDRPEQALAAAKVQD